MDVRPVIAALVDSRGWMELRMGPGTDPEVRGENLVTESCVTVLVLAMEELRAEVRESQGGRVGVAVEVSVRLDVPAVYKRVAYEFVASGLGFPVMVRLDRLGVKVVCSVGMLMFSDLAERRRACELLLETPDNIPALAPFWLAF